VILRNPNRRSAATAVEMAFIAPVFLLLIFALVIGGLGMFRYNQVAHLAREATRYASVRGMDYQRATGKPAATQTTIYQDAVRPNALTLDPNALTCTVTWDRSNYPRYVAADRTVHRNYVTVTVTYQWVPELPLIGAITLTSTSTLPVYH
jgi:Flp pilus assembly protein TadG